MTDTTEPTTKSTQSTTEPTQSTTESTQPPTEHRNDESERLDDEYNHSIESKWQDYWIDHEIYASEQATADTRFTIDTPPPTVSGDLHMGHLYQFILQDFVARFHRMRDDAVFFPLGYDDNGIASERLTEQELGIRRQDFTREEFQEKCRAVCERYETEFTENIRSLGISIDWTNTYTTIEPRFQRISQLSFIELYERGREYRQKAPTLWCPDCETAISQAEREATERESLRADIAFSLSDHPESVTISTTRPELLPACVAVFVHPDDEEHANLVGRRVTVPLFEHDVPILEDERVDRKTGTGVVMCCTFGDGTDIEWYHAHDLSLRVAIDESATMTDLAGPYAGVSTTEAREAITADLDEKGHLDDRRPITHTVHVHDRCESDIEFQVTEQWYVRMLDRTETYLEAGRDLEWYPEKMFTRYRNWVEGLEWDWCISRQRDSGVPFPVWYCADCGHAILADREQLPVNPLTDEPPTDGCPQCEHDTFIPESDVFDTWATSSLTPLVNAGWDWDRKAETMTFEHPERYPTTLRPQGHDIISFWLFHTIVKCYEHTVEVPFESVIINGMVLDENREAMSSSRGNVVTPEAVLDTYPVDAARYWAAGASVGTDFPFTEGDLEAGERLLRKLWNASKLVEQLIPEKLPDETGELAEIDRWLLARLDETVASVTEKMAAYEFSQARDELRTFFWHTFCDDYLEIAKHRDDSSTAYTLRHAHRTFLKLFAPFLPHITEEIWQECYADTETTTEKSIHTTNWPEPHGYETDPAGETAMEVVSALRRYKTENGLALNAPIDRVDVYGQIAGFEDAISDAMHVRELTVLDEMPTVTSEIVGVKLDYATLGPRFGEQLCDIEAAIEAGTFEYDDETLAVAGVRLEPESFEIEEERIYSGDGTIIETESAVVIVK